MGSLKWGLRSAVSCFLFLHSLFLCIVSLFLFSSQKGKKENRIPGNLEKIKNSTKAIVGRNMMSLDSVTSVLVFLFYSFKHLTWFNCSVYVHTPKCSLLLTNKQKGGLWSDVSFIKTKTCLHKTFYKKKTFVLHLLSLYLNESDWMVLGLFVVRCCRFYCFYLYELCVCGRTQWTTTKKAMK